MNISIGCIILAQKRQISYSMKKPAYYFFYSTLGPVQYYNIHRTGLLKTGAKLEKSFIHFIQVNFTSEKVRSKPHLSTQWARVQVATYTQKMVNKIGNHCGWEKFESCLSNGQNELQVFFKPCSHWKSVRKKKQPTFCNATKGFSMKWCLRNKHRNSIPWHHLARELLKALQNVACFLRLLKVTSFKCSSNAANVSDPVFLLFIISLTSSLTKRVKIEKNCRGQAVPVKSG